MFNLHLHKWRAQWIFTKYTHFLSWSMAQWWRRQWQPTPVLLPGKSHGQRSLVGCSPWGHWRSDTTERLHFHFWLSCIGEGNGNPVQCSCLENPRDGGAWWASVYGVTKSRTQLKRLSIVEMSCNTKEGHEIFLVKLVFGNFYVGLNWLSYILVAFGKVFYSNLRLFISKQWNFKILSKIKEFY